LICIGQRKPRKSVFPYIFVYYPKKGGNEADVKKGTKSFIAAKKIKLPAESPAALGDAAFAACSPSPLPTGLTAGWFR
jgi:hypothetical protein